MGLLSYFVVALATIFYFYVFILQVSTAVMVKPLSNDLAIDAAGVSFIFSAYFITYTPMQIYAGLLFDRYGPRRVLALATGLCALGALVLGLSTGMVSASIGRLLSGAGSACSFIGVLVLIARWFRPNQFALAAGVAQFMCSDGAIVCEGQLAQNIHRVGWRTSINGLAVIGFLLMFLIWFYIRDDDPQAVNHPKKAEGTSETEMQRLKAVLCKKQTWWVALYGFAIWAPIVVFAGFWGIEYLKQDYGFSTIAAGQSLAWMWLGVGLGSPFLGWLSDRIALRRMPLALVALTGAASSFFLLFVNGIAFAELDVVLFIMGFAASGQSACFAVVRENHKHEHVGTAAGVTNFAVVAGGLILTPLIGMILRHYAYTHSLRGLSHLSVGAYQQALVIVPICYVLAFFAAIVGIKETHARSVVD